MNGGVAWLTRDQARVALARRGYGKDLITEALDTASRNEGGTFSLARHQVRYDRRHAGPAPWLITPLPWSGEGNQVPTRARGLQLTDTAMARPEVLARLQRLGLDDVTAVQAIEQAPRTGDGIVLLGGIAVQYRSENSYDLWLRADLIPGAWPDLTREWDVGEILAAIRLVDAHLDANTAQAYRDQPLAGHMSRIGKPQSEAREAMEALAGVTGENPRKGVCDTWEHVLEELGDTACAALLGIQHVTKDTDATWAVFLAALAKALARLPQERPFPPESGMDEQAATGNGIIG